MSAANSTANISFLIVPVVLFIIAGLGIILVVVGILSIIKARASGVSTQYVERMLTDLKKENAQILTELAAMKATLGSIDKMMKEIE